ncbi:hypothetical protein TNCV_4762071 [Trichonephila clavipes]|nr:hypothetical protein TNCV_4762071 [Trichonephila clavipes]
MHVKSVESSNVLPMVWCGSWRGGVPLLRTFLIYLRCGQLTFRMADCDVDGATRYCKPPIIHLPGGSEGKQRAMTEEAAIEEILEHRRRD